MAFGKATGDLGRDRRTTTLLSEPERLELLDINVIRGLASAARLDRDLASPVASQAQLLERALLLREIVHRSGQVELLVLADKAAERVARAAGRDRAVLAAARLQQALCALEGAQLGADQNGFAVAAARLGEAEHALGCAQGRLNGPGAIRGRLLSGAALAKGDRKLMLEAVCALDDAASALQLRIRANGSGQAEFALVRCERADLLIGMGVRSADTALLHQAMRDLDALIAALDANYLPLSYGRAQALRGSALRALGETTGEARVIKEAANAFRAALEAVPQNHSPLDRARAAHGLALALQALAESGGDTRLYRSALLAFDRALDDLPPEVLTLRSNVALDRATCLTRHAERGGDVGALSEAESALKAELVRRPAKADPVAWAVTQVSLARIYEARADLLGDRGERADAAFALTSALDVFAERGMMSMSDIVGGALKRLKARHNPN